MKCQPRRVNATIVVGVLLTILLSCSSQQNPFYDPANVTMALTVRQPANAAYRVGDTVWFEVDVHLPYLIGDVTVDPGDTSDSSYTIAMPTDESIVDCIDSVSHVYGEPGSYAVAASAERTDAQIVSAVDSVAVLGLPPVARSAVDTVRVAEGAPCTLVVSATGTGPFSFEWRKDNTALSDTTAELIISSATPADEGAYRCSVTSAWGSDTSGPIQLIVMEQGWVAPPAGVQIFTQTPELFIAWEDVAGADAYRMYHSETAYDETGGYEEVTTTYYRSSQPAIHHYYWVRAVDSTLISDPSDTVFVSDTASPYDNIAPFWQHEKLAMQVREGDSAHINLNTECLDPNEGDLVTFALTGDDSRARVADSLLVFVSGAREAGVCTLTVAASDGQDTSYATVIVTIEQRSVVLMVHAENGEVTRDPALDPYRWGDTVTLSATPAENYAFSGWSGDTTAAGQLTLALMQDTTEINAVFQWAGDCIPIEAGQSLNAAIHENSGPGKRPAALCPREGLYDQGTIRIYEIVRILVD